MLTQAVKDSRFMHHIPPEFISVRAAMTVFPGEIYHVPRSWAERK
jgi:hypothetical protein